MKRGFGAWLLSGAVLMFLFARNANAYLDPGTGSYVFQTILGIAFGVGYMVKVYWRQIRARLSRPRSPKPLR